MCPLAGGTCWFLREEGPGIGRTDILPRGVAEALPRVKDLLEALISPWLEDPLPWRRQSCPSGKDGGSAESC
jgi:hypothetical protein